MFQALQKASLNEAVAHVIHAFGARSAILDFDRYAQAVGLDLVAFGGAIDGREFAADVDADRELGKKLDVSELPALFVNGKHVRFSYGMVELSELLDPALAQKP